MGTKLSAFCEKFIEAGWLAAVITVPLFFNVYSARSYEPDKMALLRSIASLMLLAWVVATVEKGLGQRIRQNGFKPLWEWFRKPLVLPVLLVTVSLGLSTVLSISMTQSLWGSYTRLQGTYSALSYIVIFALVAGYLRTREQVRRLLSIVILASLPVTLYAIIQHLGFDPLVTASTGARVRANLGNAIFLASYLIMVVPLTLVRLIESVTEMKRKGVKSWGDGFLALTYSAVLALQLTVIVLTRSRGPMVGLMLGLLLLGFLVFLRLPRRLWFGWLALAVVAGSILLLANLRNAPFSHLIEPLREIPYVSRLTTILDTQGRTAQVRILTWDAAVELILSEEPLGIQGDELSGEDRFHRLRPVVGYGPETIFNALSRVYPPRLAHIEGYNRQADRSHNETIDLLLTIGLLGVLAFYSLILSLFYYSLRWLGLVPHRTAQRFLLFLMLSGAILGGLTAYLLDSSGSRLTFIASGFPLGLVGGILVYLLVSRLIWNQGRQVAERLLLAGFLSALVAHFIETHFVFSFSATHLYFWVYAGSVVAVAKQVLAPVASGIDLGSQDHCSKLPGSRHERIHDPATRAVCGVEADSASQARRSRGVTGECWVFSILSGIVLVVLAFDFLLPSIPVNLSSLIIFVLTWTFGLILTILETSREAGNGDRPSVRVILAYGAITVGSLSLFTIGLRLGIPHLSQLLRIESVDLSAAQRVEITAFFGFYLLLMLGLLAFALVRPWNQTRFVSHFWKVALYAPATLLIGVLIVAQNFNEVRGDIYLKRAQSALNRQNWDQAIGLVRAAHRVDPSEDQYCLRMANAYQHKAADRRFSAEERAEAAEYGERFAHAALELNPLNPDHLVNLGRYYFSLGPARYKEALEFTRKATLLAPGRVSFRFLLAQIHFKNGDYEETITELRNCNSIDHRYPLAWLLLGDVYLKLNDVDRALHAHSLGMSLRARRLDGFANFANEGLDARLNAYCRAGRLEDLVVSLEQVAAKRPREGAIPWVVGRGYYLDNQIEKAIQQYQTAIPLLEAKLLSSSAAITQERLAHAYIVVGRTRTGVDLFCRLRGDSCETKLFELGVELVARQLYPQASEAFAKVVELNGNNASAHKNLGVMYYYHLDRREDGLRHFGTALELEPNRPDAGEIKQLLRLQ